MVDGIVYVSEAARKGMAKHVPGLDRIPSAVVRNFVAMTCDRSMPTSTSGDLVTVGGLEIAKNHEYLLRVLDAANRRGHRYTLDLVGDGPCRGPLERLSKSLGMEDQVQVPGSRSDVRSLLPRYRAYVHTSLRESLCMAIIEAMACGLPVVAGAVGGIPELFEPGARDCSGRSTTPKAAASDPDRAPRGRKDLEAPRCESSGTLRELLRRGRGGTGARGASLRGLVGHGARGVAVGR